MQEKLELLKRLQEIDLRIRKISINIDEYPRKIAEVEEKLSQKRIVCEQRKKTLEELERDRKKKEDNLRFEEERVKQWEARLKEIKNNRDYQALLREIAAAKRDNSLMEEEILKELEEIEEIKKELEQDEPEYRHLEEEFNNTNSELKDKFAQDEKELGEQAQIREKIARDISTDLLKKYDLIRKQRAGLALVPAKNSACQGCNMDLPPQVYNEVRRNKEIILCPNCQRIIYWEEG
ncbi:MAG: hypothetical protein JSU92_10055 [Deltaproteobacteria bacterium]|nr:MAG: hypothetical protein JSU92_10055 [Deltaproteobacteria bacterium]